MNFASAHKPKFTGTGIALAGTVGARSGIHVVGAKAWLSEPVGRVRASRRRPYAETVVGLGRR
jgi:hypothetical protein